MPVQVQTAPVAFRGGLDLKTSPFQVAAGKLLQAVNVVFSQPGALRLRNGFAALTTAILSSTTGLSSGQALMAYLSELLLCNGLNLYSWDAANSIWSNRGTILSCNVTEASVVRNTYSQTTQDGVTHSSGLQCFVWEDTQGGSRYCIRDSITGQTVVPSATLGTNGSLASRPKVIVVEGRFVIYYYRAGTTLLYVASISVDSPATTPTFTALTGAATDEDSLDPVAPNFDVTVATSAGAIYLVFNNNDLTHKGTTVRQYAFSSLTAKVNQGTVPDYTADYSVTIAYAPTVVLGTRWDVVVLFSGVHAASDFVNVASFTAALTLLGNGSVGDADITKADFVAIVPVATSLTQDIRYVISTKSSGGLTKFITVQGVLSATTVAIYRAWLAGKGFVSNGVAYVPLLFSSTLQATIFVVSESGATVAKLNPGTSVARTVSGTLVNNRPTLPEVTALDSTSFSLSVGIAEQLITDTMTGGTSFKYQTGVGVATFDFFEPSYSFLRAELARNMHIGGGFLWMYDGVKPVEHGFHWYPEGVSSAITAAANKNLSAGSYQWVVCYEWTDNQGQVHRSAPSPVTSDSTKTATADDWATITIPTLTLTAKATPIQCVVYRTVANGSVFYRVGSVNNSTAAVSVSFVDDTITDLVLIGKPQLYTTGGVLENIEPDACGSLTVHMNRLWAVDTTAPLQIWYSKQVPPSSSGTPGAPVEFSDSFILNADPRGGDVTAIGSLDDKLIIFKASHIFYVTGQGPSATGALNDFSDPQLVTTDCGCVNPRSVVTTPDGLMFQSEKGIYLLSRGLAVSYIGAEVEAYNDRTVTSSVLVADTNQVRFTMASDDDNPAVVLVYDYYVRQWATFSGINAVDSTIWQRTYAYLRSNGRALLETKGQFTDEGNFIPMTIQTSWLQFAGLQGFQRAFNAYLLGQYISAHRLNVGVAYDFNPVATQNVVITPEIPSVWGSGSGPWGNLTTWGGDYQPYQWKVGMQRQKCQAIQLTISTQEVVGQTPGESMSLSAMTFEVGVLPGANRVRARNSVG